MKKRKIHVTNQSLCHTVLLWLNEKINKWNIQITFQMNDHYQMWGSSSTLITSLAAGKEHVEMTWSWCSTWLPLMFCPNTSRQPTTWSKQQQLWELGTIKTRELGCRCNNSIMSPPTARYPGTDELESFRYLRAETSVHHLRSSPAARRGASISAGTFWPWFIARPLSPSSPTTSHLGIRPSPSSSNPNSPLICHLCSYSF